MIKVTKTKNIPMVLKKNQAIWTKELLDKIKKYGSYNDLPKNIKVIVGERYKHQGIKKLLVPTEDTKCVFCGTFPSESSYIEIEHYFPKSIYPEKTYDWFNLLPSCKRCNLKKLTLDTGKNPIIKPDINDPSEYFTYNNIKIIVKKNTPDNDVSKRTIERLDLNQHRLIKLRSELLVSLVDYESELEKTLEELSKAKNINKKNRLHGNILESLDKIEALKRPECKLSGFCKDFMENSSIFMSAKVKINDIPK